MRNITGFLASLLFAAALGCSEPQQIIIVPLEVTSTGDYMVNGTAVSIDELKEKLHAIRSAGNTPSLHIDASREAAYEAVGRVVKAANDVGASVAFVTPPPKP